MKAITLLQPWASLIAHGVKQHETRSWAPPCALIGQRIAIHAAKQKIDQLTGNLPPAAWVPAVDALSAAIGDFRWKDLPLGVVVCTGVLSAAYQCGVMNDDGQVYVARSISRGSATGRGPNECCRRFRAALHPVGSRPIHRSDRQGRLDRQVDPYRDRERTPCRNKNCGQDVRLPN